MLLTSALVAELLSSQYTAEGCNVCIPRTFDILRLASLASALRLLLLQATSLASTSFGFAHSRLALVGAGYAIQQRTHRTNLRARLDTIRQGDASRSACVTRRVVARQGHTQQVRALMSSNVLSSASRTGQAFTLDLANAD